MGLLSLEEDHRGVVPEYKSLCIFTKGNGASQIEFVIPAGANYWNIMEAGLVFTILPSPLVISCPSSR
jgi:hypothetical protein